MNRNNNILTKILMLLTLTVGWGGSAWAQRIEPVFAADEMVLDTWHYITFPQKSNSRLFANEGTGKLNWGTATPDDSYKWYVIGDKDDFILKSVTGKYVFTTQTGTGRETQYQITSEAASATHFNLVNGNDNSTWAIHRIGGDAGNNINYRGGNVLAEWTVDAGCSVTFGSSNTIISLSEEPSTTDWAPGTKWFTWRSNRSNQAANHNRHYISTSANSVDNDHNLTPVSADAPTDRGGYWAFAGDNSGGFRIYNAAYGPAFILAYTNSKYTMVPKNNIPQGAQTVFTYDYSTVKDAGVEGYTFRIGTSGVNHIHCTNSTLTAWNNGSNGHPRQDDTGSSFMVSLADDAILSALPQYEVYHSSTAGLTYNGPREVFGKQNATPYLILGEGVEITKEHVTPNAEIESLTVTTPVGSYIKEINVVKEDEFSPAPSKTEWAVGTKWFTWRSNRSNQGDSQNRHYMSTSTNSVNDDCSLTPTQATMPADRGSYWCFVGDNISGFQIYNAAYGPEFVLGCSGDGTSAKYTMVHKDDAASYKTIFTFVESTIKDGASRGYAFRLGTTGNNHVHVTNSTLRNWDHASGMTTDTGSSFMITAADMDEFNALPEYDVYKVETNAGSVSYNGTREVFGKRRNSPYFVLAKGDPEVTQADIQTSRDIESFNLTTPSETYIKTISLTLALPYILHRQHAVFDHLHSSAKKPNGKFIQDGAGMLPHPYASTFTDAAGYNANDRTMQNTSVFHITQYAKKGGTTQVRMPYRRERDGSTQNSKYQRWYNYETERLLEPGIVDLPGFAIYANGQVKTSGPLGITNITLPTTKDEITVGVDASEFEDFSYDSNGNLIEPSLSMHVIIHVKDAAQMADALTTTGDTWWEEKTYIVPNIKRGSTAHKNNVDLLPLDMPFTNYWIYDNSHNLMRIVEEGGNYNNLANNLVVEVEGSAASYITADIFKNNGDTGIGDPPPVASNHFIYYKVNGSGLTRVVPAGTQAIIKVYARNGVSGTRYQLAKYTLNFQAETEPLAITSVIGNEMSTRSSDYFLKNGMKEVANLTFKETAANFTAIKGQGVQEGTYAFPLDPTRTSYSYSPNNAFAGYRITKKAYGMKTHPVSLYEQNIKSPEGTPALNIDPNDYYFYVDASEAPGQVASIPLDGNLCRGSKLYFYGWLASQNPCESSATSASVILELIGRKGGQETILARYAPGVISDVAYNPEGGLVRSVQNGKTASELGAFSYSYNINGHGDDQNRVAAWQSIGFNYTLSEAGYDGFELRVLNNCFSTAGGDYSLDDFRVFVKTPQVNVDNAAPICGDELSIVRISTDFDALMDALQGGSEGEKVTYYGTYAVLDKDIYDNQLASKANPTTADLAEAFNMALMGETDKSKCTIGGKFLPELYAFHDIKFYSDYLSHDHITYSTLVGDNILETAGYMYQYNQNGDIISRNLVFNCKITDERIAGKKYYLVFHANVVPQDMTAISKANYASFFSMGDICCVISEFQTMRATMVKVNGEEELDPYGIDYCPGTAPTISLNSYGYNINGEIIQEHGVYYDWYFGTKEQFKTERVWLDGADIDIDNINNYTHREILTAEDFCMEHCLMNFRHFYPNAGVNELYDGTVQVHHFEKDDETDTEYELTEKMIAKLKEWVEAGKLRLHLTAVSVDLGAHNAQGDTHILAIPQGAKLRYEQGNPTLYCIAPVEISFHTNLEAPGASVGLAGVDYSVTPYDRDVAGSGVYHSLPLRINNVQIDAIRQGKELEVPIRVILPSGYYKVNDGAGLVNTHRIHLDIDDADNDIYVAETNDPQWQLRSIDGSGGEYLPSVGKLLRIDANKERTEGYDLMIIQFNDATHDNQIRFVPREGYYYVLRTQFTENINPGVTLAPEYTVPEVKCKGNILIPLKIVPEYMKWTGRESNDWNNDRNWIRADYRDLVPSDAQNLSQAYANYETNTANSEAYTRQRRYNGLPVSANDNVANEAKKDIYIPMDMPSASSLYNTFAYAPMVETSVIIPSDAEPYPVVTAHPKTAENLVRLTESGDGTNTPWIAYDMVSVRQPDGNYMAERYYENKINNITFEPASQLVNAQNLTYNKAWVEYELKTGRWYTLASPLQNTFAGEWYSPTAGGKQQTPQFYDITYQQGGGSQNLNDRFRPAYYQRSWDNKGNELVYTKTGNDYSYYIAADWSHVYNDVTKEYSNGGFSVMVEDGYMGGNAPADGKALVRLPKADKKYTYFDIDGSTGQKADDTLPIYTQDATGAFILNQGAQPSKLFTDKLKTAGEFTQTITNETAGNNFFLVGNPFMANLDMDEFFAQNTQLEKKFWIMTEDGQAVSVKVDGSQWVGTTGSKVAPLQGFFVKGTGNTTTIRYTADMQSEPTTTAPLKAKGKRSSALQTLTIQAKHNGMTTTAIVALSEDASVDFVSNEDCETFIDSNTADQPTIYTVASGQAMTVNTVPAFENIPVGIVGEAEGSIEVTFSGFEDTLYLYDSVSGTRTELNDGTTVTMEGNTTGRYFITSAATGVDMATEDKQVKVKKGVWTISGIYCGETTQGVRPGLYIVDGVRMMIR